MIDRHRIDWKAWLALGWAAVFSLLYVRMVLQERAPATLRTIERAASFGQYGEFGAQNGRK